jgi:PAS domain S-box-containing protein
MQSIVVNLPDEHSVFSFVCRGLTDVPGVARAEYSPSPSESLPASVTRLSISAGSFSKGELLLTVTDPEAFAPYLEYLQNFSFMLGVIFEERRQRDLVESHKKHLEERVLERTLQLREQIEERERTQEDLRQSRALLNDILDSMPSVVVGISDQGLVTHWNESAAAMTGVARKDILDKPPWVALPMLASLKDKLDEALAQKQAVFVRKVPFTRDNDLQLLNIMFYPLQGKSTGGLVVRIDDATEQERLHEIMIQTEKMMSVGGLAAGMAHEINNPLSGIMQSAQVLLSRLTDDSPANLRASREAGCELTVIHDFLRRRDILTMIGIIQDAAQRAAHIVSGMLEFSRKSESSLAPTDINQLIVKSLELCSTDYSLKKKYDFRNILIVRDFAPNLPEVPCSKTQIQQVLMNLLSNAAHALSGLEPGHEPASIVVRTAREDRFIRIEIEDNGPGMDEMTKRKIFEPFFTTKPVGEGTGLGLSVSYFIVTSNHHGTIEVDSWPGMGAKFTIRLPLRDQ